MKDFFGQYMDDTVIKFNLNMKSHFSTLSVVISNWLDNYIISVPLF